MAKDSDTSNSKFLITDNIDSKEVTNNKDTKKNMKVRKMYFSYNFRVIIYSLLIFVFLMATFVSYFSLYLACCDRVVSYNEESDVSYNVCLDENTIYDDLCLKEGMEYLSSLTNKVNSKFFYHVDFSSEIEYDLDYNVIAKTKIYSEDEEKILYEHEEELIAPKNVADSSKSININQIVEVDYKRYAELVSNYIENYANDAFAEVEVIFYLIEPTETRKISSLIIPLVGKTYSVEKEIISYKDEVHLKNNTWNDTNTTYGVVGTACLLLLMFFIFNLTRLIIKATKRKNRYQVELTRILRDYDRYIVIARDGYKGDVVKNVIKISSFKELLDARNTLNKPIIYSEVNNVKCEFIVEDDTTLYKYVMKEADFED